MTLLRDTFLLLAACIGAVSCLVTDTEGDPGTGKPGVAYSCVFVESGKVTEFCVASEDVEVICSDCYCERIDRLCLVDECHPADRTCDPSE